MRLFVGLELICPFIFPSLAFFQGLTEVLQCLLRDKECRFQGPSQVFLGELQLLVTQWFAMG